MQSLAACITWWEVMEMLEIFAYRTVAVVHFTDQSWIPKTVYYIRCVMVSKIGFTNWKAKIHFSVRPWLLLTILNFSERGLTHNGIFMSLLLLVAKTTVATIKILTMLLLVLTMVIYLITIKITINSNISDNDSNNIDSDNNRNNDNNKNKKNNN